MVKVADDTVNSSDYLKRIGTVVESDEVITIVHYEYDGITEEIAWPTEILKELLN